jgi:hypothetical protein
MLLTSDIYAIQFCREHKLTIYYFKNNKMLKESQCWFCVAAANKRKAAAKSVPAELPIVVSEELTV